MTCHARYIAALGPDSRQPLSVACPNCKKNAGTGCDHRDRSDAMARASLIMGGHSVQCAEFGDDAACAACDHSERCPECGHATWHKLDCSRGRVEDPRAPIVDVGELMERAERAERERDEALRLRDAVADEWLDRSTVLKRERDEARAEVERLRARWRGLREDVRRVVDYRAARDRGGQMAGGHGSELGNAPPSVLVALERACAHALGEEPRS